MVTSQGQFNPFQHFDAFAADDILAKGDISQDYTFI